MLPVTSTISVQSLKVLARPCRAQCTCKMSRAQMLAKSVPSVFQEFLDMLKALTIPKKG